MICGLIKGLHTGHISTRELGTGRLSNHSALHGKCKECHCASLGRPITLPFARGLAGLIQHLLRTGMTEAEVCAQRRGAKCSKHRVPLGREHAGGAFAFVEIPRAKCFRGATKIETEERGMNSTVTETPSFFS